MSKLPIDLGDRRVVVSVLVLLGAIMTLNWRVFQPLRARHTYQDVAQEEAVYLPPDLGEMTGVAAARVGAAGAAAAAVTAGQTGSGDGFRDPFRTRTDPPPPPAPSRAARNRRAAPAPRLICAAVMLGGQRPTALIDGKRYHPGDSIAGYRVERIDADGAYLDGTAGRLFLPVGGAEDEKVHYPPVRGAQASGAGNDDKRSATRDR